MELFFIYLLLMTDFLPFFPLKLVAFPGEQVNLHIFEPRYQQLVNECLENNSKFGMPVFIEDLMEHGSEMEVVDLVKQYPGGEMDIVTKCTRVFYIRTYVDKVNGKLYAGGEVQYLKNIQDGEASQWKRLIALATNLTAIIELQDKVKLEEMNNSFELAHKIGLSLEQECELLQMEHESARIQYMISHLERAIPIIKEMERAKEVIKMNGHFKHLDPLNF